MPAKRALKKQLNISCKNKRQIQATSVDHQTHQTHTHTHTPISTRPPSTLNLPLSPLLFGSSDLIDLQAHSIFASRLARSLACLVNFSFHFSNRQHDRCTQIEHHSFLFSSWICQFWSLSFDSAHSDDEHIKTSDQIKKRNEQKTDFDNKLYLSCRRSLLSTDFGFDFFKSPK